jgi:phosphatidylglycerophosphate synthase
MSKLPSEYQFLDLSDYGRPFGKVIAKQLQFSRFHAVHVTLLFVITAAISLVFLWKDFPKIAALLLILKSIIDAADGELARLQNRPSYIGRYLDSVSDILINLCLILSIGHLTNTPIWIALLAFASLQLQGTLYNYYYVILRNEHQGDTTSRIFERKVPKALGSENQQWVNRLYYAYKFCYGIFDKMIYTIDHHASTHKNFPKWFMTALSTFGLGFQLLVIAFLIALNQMTW